MSYSPGSAPREKPFKCGLFPRCCLSFKDQNLCCLTPFSHSSLHSNFLFKRFSTITTVIGRKINVITPTLIIPKASTLRSTFQLIHSCESSVLWFTVFLSLVKKFSKVTNIVCIFYSKIFFLNCFFHILVFNSLNSVFVQDLK